MAPGEKNFKYSSFKKPIVLKIINMNGEQNGAIRHFSVVAQIKRQVSLYSLTITSTFKFPVYSDPEGRYVICDLITNGKQLTLANIYAPNEDDPNFFTSTFNHLLDFNCDDIIIGGDFNLVLDVEKDKKGGTSRTHKESLEIINNFCESLDLLDAWSVKPRTLWIYMATKKTSSAF